MRVNNLFPSRLTAPKLVLTPLGLDEINAFKI